MQNLEKALNLKLELDSLRPISPEQEAKIMQKFRLDWNYHSNNLEGNSLTYGETRALLMEGLTSQGKPLKDHEQIKGHNKAIEWIEEIVKGDFVLTENFIRQLNLLLLVEPYEIDAITNDGKLTKKLVEPGKYKTSPNHVKTVTGAIFYFANPEETAAKMHDLMSWYKNEIINSNINPIILAAQFHYKFIRIHPFDDGNGRTARILMNLILMKFGFPPAIIKTEDKNNYFYSLSQADAGNIEVFVDYIAKNLIFSLELIIAGAKGKDISELDDIYKKLTLLTKQNNSVKITKNRDSIIKVYEDSIVKFLNHFLNSCEKFNQSYLSTNLLIKGEGGLMLNSVNLPIPQIKSAFLNYKDRISESLSQIYINYRYLGLNIEGCSDFNYNVICIIKFDLEKYSIECEGEIIEKKYKQQINESEMIELITYIVQKHYSSIEDLLKNDVEL